MKSIKKIILTLIIILTYQYNYGSAQEKSKPVTKKTTPMIQHAANVKNDTMILKKLTSINSQDTNDIKMIQQRSYNLLLNNIIHFKKFIIDTFTKNQLQELCNELIDQIYPETSFNAIDFGQPIKPAVVETEKKEILTEKMKPAESKIESEEQTNSSKKEEPTEPVKEEPTSNEETKTEPEVSNSSTDNNKTETEETSVDDKENNDNTTPKAA